MDSEAQALGSEADQLDADIDTTLDSITPPSPAPLSPIPKAQPLMELPTLSALLDNKLDSFLARLLEASQQSNERIGAKLDAMITQMQVFDARLVVVERGVAETNEAVANVRQHVADIKKAVDLSNTSPNGAGAVETIFLDGVAARLESLVLGVEAVKIPVAEPRPIPVAVVEEVQELSAFSDIAARLESLASANSSFNATKVEVNTLDSLASRLETVASTTSQLDGIRQVVESMQARLARMEAFAPAESANADQDESGCESVANRVDLILERQVSIGLQLRDSLSRGRNNNSAELVAQIAELDSKVERLPLIYMDIFSASLQRQTHSLMGIMDDIIKEQTETISAAAASGRRVGLAGFNGVVGGVVGSIPYVPDLGIRKRFSRLTANFGLRRDVAIGVDEEGEETHATELVRGEEESVVDIDFESEYGDGERDTDIEDLC
ncbi:hypothetical protein HDU98_003117 [Podochytrium sp. JEL0797]|nr:hypothetical protein HDU98_003117 [Podochytrium sp. JEL0797]